MFTRKSDIYADALNANKNTEMFFTLVICTNFLLMARVSSIFVYVPANQVLYHGICTCTFNDNDKQVIVLQWMHE